MARELDDISAMTVSPETLAAYQARISAAGEMRQAVQEFLDAYYDYRDDADLDLSERRGVKDRRALVRRRLRAMEKSAEAFANMEVSG